MYIQFIKESNSLCEVCRKAGICATTGNYDTLKRLIKDENIDTSHFKRISNNTKKGVAKEKHGIEDYFNGKYHITSYKLKNLLLKEGYKEHRCENPLCGRTEWNGQPIPLELHHINGDNTDNHLENLQLLCPNCHTQTSNFSGKKKRVEHTRKCPICGKIIENERRKYCSKECYEKSFEFKKNNISYDTLVKSANKCSSLKELSLKLNVGITTIKDCFKRYNTSFTIHKKKVEKPIDINLLQLMKKYKNFTIVGKILNISDNGVKKRLKNCGLPYHINDILKYIDDNNI